MQPNTTEFFLASLGEIEDATVLERINRKLRRQFRKVGVDPDEVKTTRRSTSPPTPAVDLKTLSEGDEVTIGTEHGEKTRAKVLKVNAKRVKVEILDKRGRKKAHPKGSEMDLYPDMIRSVEVKATPPLVDDAVTAKATDTAKAKTNTSKAKAKAKSDTNDISMTVNSLTPGDQVIIGTENGEQTKAKVLKVNAKRVKVETLEGRGTRKPQPKGTHLDVYPEMIRARA